VGVIGLGAGTIAAYGRAGDRYTFYEINPLDIQIARERFAFLRESPASVEIIPGDARLSLERGTQQGFDVLAVDAFSGDSIPVHLLTREALQLYFGELRPGGLLAVHISNNYLNLEPVVRAAASSLGKQAVRISNPDDHPNGIYAASWILVGDAATFAAHARIGDAGTVLAPARGADLWTDDYSSLFPLLK
jgi:spermidine synthase